MFGLRLRQSLWTEIRAPGAFITRLLLLLAAALCGVGAKAQPTRQNLAAPSRNYEVVPVADGWQPNPVTCLQQTRDGYLWFGTYNGLVRFDGARFVVFDSVSTPGLQNSRITSLYEDRAGTLWIGHETGHLSRRVRGHFEGVIVGTNATGRAVEAITSDENGDMWYLKDDGLIVRLRDGKPVTVPGGGSATRKTALTQTQDGTVWLVANGTAATLEGGTIKPFLFSDAAPNDYYQRVAGSRDGGLWVAGNGRNRKWLGGKWVVDLGECPCDLTSVTALLETRSGGLLVGTLDQGLYLTAPGSGVLHFSRTNGLSHDWVRALCEDTEGDVWIGTGSGLDTLRPRKVTMIAPPDHCEGRNALSFVVAADGTTWLGTEGAGIYRYLGTTWTHFGEAQGLSNLFVWSLLLTREGQLYAGTWGGGIFVWDGERFQKATGELGQLATPVVALYRGRQGEMWIGTQEGLYRSQAGQLTLAAGKDKLALPDVRAIVESADGTLWFGLNGGGLGALKQGVVKQFRKSDGLSSDFVQTLLADNDGTLWIGTSDNGLCRLRQGAFATIASAQGLPSKVISHIVDDSNGDLWLGCNQGILRLKRTELNRCAEGLVKTVHCLGYGKAEGMASLSCSGGFQPGACKVPSGQVWFPTMKGLAAVDPGDMSMNMVPPWVVIEELRVDSVAMTLTPPSEARPTVLDKIRIPPGRHRLEVSYTALSFPSPDKVLFKHQLQNLEQEWSGPDTKRIAEYSYLPPGDYSFRVIACNNDQLWNEKGVSLPIEVQPFLWQTWWFQAGAIGCGAIVLGGVVIAVTRRRVRRRVDQLERQQAIERERARIARDIHDDLGASLTRITMLSQSAQAELQGQQEAAGDVEQIYRTARELTRAMDEIVWAVNPQHDTLDSLVTYLGRFAQQFLSASAIRCRLDVPVNLPPLALTAEIRHNVFLAFKEALNNVVKHARASEVQVSLQTNGAGFMLAIADNGCGFNADRLLEQAFSGPASGLQGENPQPLFPGATSDSVAATAAEARLTGGNGLTNMRKRMVEIGGGCHWKSTPHQGTRVELAVILH